MYIYIYEIEKFWSVCLLMSHEFGLPEVTVQGRQDVKIQLLTN